MARKKLKHFAEMKEWTHVLEPTLAEVPLHTAGTWGERVMVELACGRGTYTVGLARLFPDFTVVGVDIKGSRMWHGAKLALDEGLGNARFLRILIEDLLKFFAPHEVDELWITFPDPHPTEGNEKRRLTSPRFLELYKKVLKPGGLLHLKTDNEPLFHYSLQRFKEAGFTPQRVVEDVYGGELKDPLLQEVQTAYEQRYLKEGRQIRYAVFSV